MIIHNYVIHSMYIYSNEILYFKRARSWNKFDHRSIFDDDSKPRLYWVLGVIILGLPWHDLNLLKVLFSPILAQTGVRVIFRIGPGVCMFSRAMWEYIPPIRNTPVIDVLPPWSEKWIWMKVQCHDLLGICRERVRDGWMGRGMESGGIVWGGREGRLEEEGMITYNSG